MLHAIVIFCGLSLDSVIVMMQKGAQLRKLTTKQIFLYALVFSLVTMGMFMTGYITSIPIQSIISEGRKINATIASLIVFFVGVFLLTKSFMKKDFEEKVDKDFGYKSLIRQAVYTSIDTFFVGAAFGFMGIHMLPTMIISLVVTFIGVFIAIEVGYNIGARYQRVCGIIGGSLMVLFSIIMIAMYVVR